MNPVTRPDVAICIPTYNQARFVVRAVESALRQEEFPTAEVWVSDDCSTDETPVVMAELCKREPRVRYHRHEKNLGIAENASWVLQQPNAPIVVRLDSDDMLLPRYLATLMERLLAHPQAGYAHSAVDVVDADGATLTTARLFRPREYVGADAALRESLRGYKTVANILMFRAEALRRADFYRGRPNFAEDYDLSIRLADLGYGNVYVDQVLAQYRVWSDTRGLRNHRKAEHLRGLIAIFNHSLVEAYQRRNWSLGEVLKARRAMALRFAPSIFVPWIDATERETLVPLLFRLDDGLSVRLRVRLLRMGLSPLFTAVARADELLRRTVKNTLARVRPR